MGGRMRRMRMGVWRTAMTLTTILTQQGTRAHPKQKVTIEEARQRQEGGRKAAGRWRKGDRKLAGGLAFREKRTGQVRKQEYHCWRLCIVCGRAGTNACFCACAAALCCCCSSAASLLPIAAAAGAQSLSHTAGVWSCCTPIAGSLVALYRIVRQSY